MFLEHFFQNLRVLIRKFTVMFMHEHLCFILQQRPKSIRNWNKECDVSLTFLGQAASYSGKYAYLLTQTKKPKFVHRLQNKVKTIYV